jgi:Putative MetA-pathway of phenol degradation
MSTRPVLCCSLALLIPCSAARADTPAFDRPGISFSTTTLPPGTFAWEQGLPDFQHQSQNGTRTTQYSADTNLRLGLTDRVELQLGIALFNYLKTEGGGITETDRGYGNVTLALKAALPDPFSGASLALLGSVTPASGSGQAPFRGDAPQYQLGSTLSLDLGSSRSVSLYANVSQDRHQTTLALSPSLGFSLTDTVGAYVEAAEYLNRHGSDGAVAGGGVTWMASPTVQLDLWTDLGLTSASPDIQGGFGVSAFFQ